MKIRQPKWGVFLSFLTINSIYIILAIDEFLKPKRVNHMFTSTFGFCFYALFFIALTYFQFKFFSKSDRKTISSAIQSVVVTFITSFVIWMVSVYFTASDAFIEKVFKNPMSYQPDQLFLGFFIFPMVSTLYPLWAVMSTLTYMLGIGISKIIISLKSRIYK